VTASDIVEPIVVNLTKSGGQWVANLSGIPAGVDRTFTLSAKAADGTVIYSGVATGVTITAGQTAAVSIGGQETSPPPPVNNQSPAIDALVGSTTKVAQAGTVALSVAAHDADTGDIITFLWTATGGTLDTPAQASTGWTAPGADGVYRVTVRVQDNHGASASMYVDLTVSADTSSQATISVTLNNWPVVTDVSSTQGRINIGDSTKLDVVATDADSDPLTYAWSVDDGCAGAFDDATLKSPTFTLAGEALPVAGTCQFAVTVSDGRGGTNSGSITVTAAAPPTVNFAPRITSAVQSLASAQAGQTVNLAVQAEDPEGAALTFTWTTTAGTLGTPITNGGSSQVVWTAPSPLTADGSVSCTVADATGLTTVKTFTITAIDTLAPTLAAFSFTPTAVDVSSAGAFVTVTATVTDDLSGFKEAIFMFADPSGTQLEPCAMYKPTGSSGLRSYSGTCTVELSQHSLAGAWKVTQVLLTDEADNVIHLTTAEQVAALGFAVDLAVTSSDADVAGPVITAFAFSPSTIDTSAASVTVTASFTITDDKSGIWDAGVRLASPSGGQSQECNLNDGGTSSLSHTASCTMVFPHNSEAGVWTVTWVYATDNVFHDTWMLPADLAAAGLPSGITVASAP